MFGKGEEEEEKKDENAEVEAGEEGDAGNSVADMKDGEYILHILVETGKNIFLPGESETDPLVKVNFKGKDKQTKAFEKISPGTEVTWNEHIYIETGNVKGSEFAEELIEIRILNKGFFKSDLIGYFPISPPTIYNMKDHVVHNQIVAFTNPEAEDKSKVCAYLTLSFNLSGPGDPAAQLKQGTDKDAPKRKPWMPPSVQKKYKQLYFKFLRAENIPKMDTFGTTDGYIFLDFKGDKLRTKVDTMKDDIITWNQEMLIPLELPNSNDKLEFKLYD